MTKNRKRKNKGPTDAVKAAATERLDALDDAISAALRSFDAQFGVEFSLAAVLGGVMRSLASVVWHTTTMTEDEFMEAASDAFRAMSEAHGDCARGQRQEAPRDDGLH